VAIFWALFDQTGSSWVLQAEDMNRRWLGVTWLSSQIGAVNPIMILVFIPLFQFVIYPLINRVFTLTPMRKIALGLFVMAGGFAIIAVAQQLIDAGQRPSIGWQIVAYAVLTASEVMVSITCLEFSYTQSPRTMKSVVMALFFMSVSAGNLFTAGVNQYIIVPDGLQPAVALVQPLAAKAKGKNLDLAALEQRGEKLGLRIDRADDGAFRVTIPMTDGGFDTVDAVVVEYSASGERQSVTTVENDKLFAALQRIETFWNDSQTLPSAEQGQELVAGMHDSWSNPFRYQLVTSKQFRISSNGPDTTPMTTDDINLKVTRIAKTAAEIEIENQASRDLLSFLHPERSWLDRRKAELAASSADTVAGNATSDDDAPAESFEWTIAVGGEQKLAGAQYFWFFTQVMLGTAICFLLVARLYRPKTYLQEEVPADEIAAEATSNQ
jgi:POT family proton-dependent oligopeptide transporter